MSTMLRILFLGVLLAVQGGCRTPTLQTMELSQSVSVAFGLPPEASLQDVLTHVKDDLPGKCTPMEVMAYLDGVKRRSPVAVSIGRTKKGELIIAGKENDELVEITFRNDARTREVNFLFKFGDEGLASVTYYMGAIN